MNGNLTETGDTDYSASDPTPTRRPGDHLYLSALTAVTQHLGQVGSYASWGRAGSA